MYLVVQNYKWLKLVFYLLLLGSCNSKNKSVVLDYDDFGPQVLSYQTLGYAWYEWNSHGNKEKNNIKIVVYMGDESIVHNQYKDSQNLPAVDYRFINHQVALNYLNRNIEELSKTNEFPGILERLKLTKKKIEQ